MAWHVCSPISAPNTCTTGCAVSLSCRVVRMPAADCNRRTAGVCRTAAVCACPVGIGAGVEISCVRPPSWWQCRTQLRALSQLVPVLDSAACAFPVGGSSGLSCVRFP
eukprot:262286-Chlamydomonas_euryale.AAC.2